MLSPCYGNSPSPLVRGIRSRTTIKSITFLTTLICFMASPSSSFRAFEYLPLSDESVSRPNPCPPFKKIYKVLHHGPRDQGWVRGGVYLEAERAQAKGFPNSWESGQPATPHPPNEKDAKAEEIISVLHSLAWHRNATWNSLAGYPNSTYERRRVAPALPKLVYNASGPKASNIWYYAGDIIDTP